LVKRILRYLKGIKDWVFLLEPGPLQELSIQQNSHSTTVQGKLRFSGYSDSDWGGEIESAKSTSGYGWFLGNALVSWQSKTQSITATSSTWAEYIALYHAAAECIRSRNFLAELGLLIAGPTTLYCDNEAAIKIAQFHMVTPRSKQIDTKHHYIRQQVQKQTISIKHCPGASNIADIWTKPLKNIRFASLRSRLGLCPPGSVACQSVKAKHHQTSI
jgi:hypothetical protein